MLYAKTLVVCVHVESDTSDGKFSVLYLKTLVVCMYIESDTSEGNFQCFTSRHL